jgi:hypothetical protein
MKVISKGRLVPAILIVICLTLLACGRGQQGGSQQTAAPEPVQTQAPPPAQQPVAVTPEPAAPPVQQPEAPKPEPTPKPRQARPEPVPAPAPEPKPEPKPEPRPEPIIKTIPAGTPIALEVLDPVSSKTSKAGDIVRARLLQDVAIDGLVAIPAGSVVTGNVAEAHSPGAVGGKARLALEFVSVELPIMGATPISATFAKEGKSETAKDAGTIGGAAAAGALVGRMFSKDKGKGTAIGAVVGAAAGTGIAAGATKAQQVELAPGAQIQVQLKNPVNVTIRR